MRFSKVIHPELLLGLRGNKDFHELYKKTVHKITLPETGGAIVPGLVARMNNSESRAMTLMRRWMIDNGKVYHVSHDFLSALSNVERGVSLDYLPQRFVAYISFAEATIYDDADEIEGAYVYVGPSSGTPLKTLNNDRVLWIAYICKGSMAMGTICLNLIQKETMDEMLHRIEDDNKRPGQNFIIPPVDIHKRALVHNTILNVVMYLHSQEPAIQRVPSRNELSNKKARDIANKTGLLSECLLPVTFVNWTYAGQRIYSKDSTLVSMHMRFQPFGPGLSQIKLIWIAEHVRHFNKPKENM